MNDQTALEELEDSITASEPEKDVFLHGLALKNYRGIGDDYVYMSGFRKFNIFIGPNNAGKSTVLNFIARHLPIEHFGRKGRAPEFLPHDKHRGADSVGMMIGVKQNEIMREVCYQNPILSPKELAAIFEITQNMADKNGFIWFLCETPFGAKNPAINLDYFDLDKELSPHNSII
jgi:hypothetical protein